MHEGLARLSSRELAERYDLELDGDFQTTETGQPVFLNGDLQIGDITTNALRRFVETWRYNAPMLKMAFDFVFEGKARKAVHVQRVNEVAQRLVVTRDPATRDAVADELHELNDQLGIDESGPQAFAGAIMVLLHSMLYSERTNLAEPPRRQTAGTPINGYSVGRIVEAAANNFRHSDEWMINVMTPTPRQLGSIRPLAAILGVDLGDSALAAALGASRAVPGSNHPFGRNRCPEVLEELSGGTFEGLMNVIFRYARALAYEA